MPSASERLPATPHPSITVITATLNCGKHLPGLVRSLLSQIDQEFDWVVVDGGSHDDTLTIVQTFPAHRLTVSSEKDFGIYDALNRGITLARGDYYLVVGADDELYPEAVQNFRAVAAARRWDLVAANVEIGDAIARPMAGCRWLRGGNAFVASHSVGTLIRRELHRECGNYSPKYPNCADMHFLLTVIGRSPTAIGAAGFIAGRFGTRGTSSIDRLCSESDAFRIQIALGQNRWIQLPLYVLRLMRTLCIRR
jgi:glycosyltransferase